jgi:hypothetical protein
MRVLILLAILVATATAEPPAKWTVRDRVVAGGKLHYVAIGEIDRSGVLTPLPAPELDKITDDLAAAWKAYKPAASIKITERHADTKTDHTFKFTAKDPLYPMASVRAFADANHLEMWGFNIDLMAFDEHHPPEDSDGAATTYDHFRKSTETPNFGKEGYVVGYFEHRLGIEGDQKLDAQRWISASDPKVSLEREGSPASLTAASVKLYPDGHIEYTPKYARDQLVAEWHQYTGDAVTLSIFDHEAAGTKKIAKGSASNLEATLAGQLVHYHGYDVDPAIDVAKLK